MPVLRRLASGLLALALAAEGAGAETIFVSNEQDDTIAVVNAATLAVEGVIKVGRRPRGLALSTDRLSLYVAVGDDNRIDVVDIAARRVVGPLPAGEDPEVFAVHPDGKRLFVANENDNEVTVVDTGDRRIIASVGVGVEPEGMAVSHDGRLVLCTSETTSMLHVIDAATLALIDNVLVDTRPRWAVVSPDGGRFWVSSEIRGTVTVLDAATREVLGSLAFDVPGVERALVQAVGMVMNKAGTRAYIALGPANRVAEVDAATLEVRRLFLVGQRVWHIALSGDEKRLYAANGVSGDLTVVDLERGEAITSIPVGRGPWGVAVAP